MRVTIGDLDYFYSADKVNCFNPDAMKISSYHKQKGDVVNFVLSQDDINRPYELCYIFQNKSGLKIPMQFYLDSNVRWGGKACKHRIKWRMSDAMLSCRPDYLLYPEKNTKFERAEHIRLLNDKGQRLALLQDGTNTLKNKKVIVTDTMLGSIDSNELQKALKFLSTIKNISFFEPIGIQKLVADKNNLNAFLELNLTPGAQIKGIPITIAQYQESVEIIKQIKEKFPHVDAGTLVIKIFYADHGLNNDKNQAYEDFVQIKQCIINAKENKIKIEIQDLKSRLDSPYFEIYENLHRWTADYFNLSWLEYITKIYGNGLLYSVDLWNHPEKGNDTFRNLLRQTRQDSTFLLTQGGSRKMSTNDIPWLRGEKEFEYGL